MNTKSIFTSKTFWANIIMGVAAFVPAVRETVNEQALTSVFTVVNIALRIITKDKVRLI